jgi:hypothetical protein
MELTQVLSRLEKSKEYFDWHKNHAKAFLAHAFVMLDEPNKDAWQLGYYDEQKNLMTTFIINKEVEAIPDQEIMQTGQKILELKTEQVKTPITEALALAEKTRMQNYPQEQAAKSFFIIQNSEEYGATYNITFFTATFKTINIKISAVDGKILHHSIQALVQFG